MVNLEKEPDTIISAQDPLALTEEMKIEASSNELDHNQFQSADEVDLIGDGVPGYEATSEAGTDDELEHQIEEQNSIVPKP